MSCLHHHPMLSPPQYGEYCPESASTRNVGYWRLPGRNLLKYREGKLLYSSTCNFDDKEGQCYYQDVFAVLNL